MNKETYTKPLMEEMNIETVEMMASSPTPGFGEGEAVETSEVLGNSRRGSWGNLWNGE